MKSLLHQVFSSRGRASRRQYWFGLALTFAIALAPMVYALATSMPRSEAREIIDWAKILAFVLFVPTQVRRLHDRGKSSYWVLLNGIPVLGTLWLLIELGFMRGDSGANAFGEPTS